MLRILISIIILNAFSVRDFFCLEQSQNNIFKAILYEALKSNEIKESLFFDSFDSIIIVKVMLEEIPDDLRYLDSTICEKRIKIMSYKEIQNEKIEKFFFVTDFTYVQNYNHGRIMLEYYPQKITFAFLFEKVKECWRIESGNYPNSFDYKEKVKKKYNAE